MAFNFFQLIESDPVFFPSVAATTIDGQGKSISVTLGFGRESRVVRLGKCVALLQLSSGLTC